MQEEDLATSPSILDWFWFFYAILFFMSVYI